MRPVPSVLLLCAGLVGCGSAPPAGSTNPSAEAPPHERAPSPAASEPSPEPPAQDQTELEGMLAEFFELSEPIDASETPGTREYLRGCRAALAQADDDDTPHPCESVVARSRDGDFVAIDVATDFRGRPTHLRVSIYRDGTEEELLSAPFSSAALGQLEALARGGGWGTTDNELSHTFADTFSLVSVTPFLRLSGMGADSGLWLEPGTDLDHPVYSLRHLNQDGTSSLLGTRPGVLGTSGDWACGDAMCTEDELRALGLLCVLPVNIQRAAHRDGVLVLQGFVAKTGHRDFPSFHWFVPFPSP